MADQNFTNLTSILEGAIYGAPGQQGLGAYFGVPSTDAYQSPLQLVEKLKIGGGSVQPIIGSLIQALTYPNSAMSITDMIVAIRSAQKNRDADAQQTTREEISKQFNITYDYSGVAEEGELKQLGGINVYEKSGQGTTWVHGPGKIGTGGTVAQISDMLPQNPKGTGTNKNPGDPSTVNPGLAVIQVYGARKTLTNRSIGASQVFFNGIPSLELSRCVPYFNLSIITGDPPVDEAGRLFGIGLAKAVLGNALLDEAGGDTGSDALSTIVTGRDIKALELFGVDVSNLGAAAKQATAGMEMFTAPQTFVPLDRQRNLAKYSDGGVIDLKGHDKIDEGGAEIRPVGVLDPFRPLASISSFNVTIQGQFGFQHFKKAKLDIVVHDRSRLNELAPLIRPGYLGKTKILVEYGWSHPDGSASSNNTLGQFINSLRTRDVFVVSNVIIGMDTDGQAKLDVSLHTSGAPSFETVRISTSDTITESFLLLQRIITAIQIIRKRIRGTGAAKSINMPNFLKSLRSTSSALSMDSDTLKAIDDFITSVTDDSPQDFQTLKRLMEDLTRESPNNPGALQQLKETSVSQALTEKINTLHHTPDPFLAQSDALKAGWEHKAKYISPPILLNYALPRPWISLGKLLTIFVGNPLTASGEFSEVQFIFYCFNQKAGFVRNLNMAQFPIHVDTFKQFYVKQIRRSGNDMALSSFLGMIKKYFVSAQQAKAYGLSNIYELDGDGYEIREAFSESSKLENEISKRMMVAYGASTATGDRKVPLETINFVLPKMGYLIETLPRRPMYSATDPNAGATKRSRTIMRVHVFDQAHSSNSTPRLLMKAALDNAVGVIGRGAQRKRTVGKDPQHVDEYTDWIEYASKTGVIRPIGPEVAKGTTSDQPKYVLAGGYQALKNFISLGVPTIKYGTNSSMVTNLSVQTQNNPLLANIAIQRAHRNTSGSPTGYQPGGLPMQIMPLKLQMRCIGNPLLHYGQEYFIDMQTGTSADNIYRCMQITHSLAQGKFESSLDMTIQDSFQAYNPVMEPVHDALQLIKEYEQ